MKPQQLCEIVQMLLFAYAIILKQLYSLDIGQIYNINIPLKVLYQLI